MGTMNFRNRTLFHGDNLEFLRGMNSDTVDLIATDPPFNKNKDFHATPDSLARGARFTDRWSWDRDVHDEWEDQIKDDWPGVWSVLEAAKQASGDDMAAFLAWLGVRLMECQRVLKPTGSLYLHIDHTAHAWTKALLDSIFGRKHFRNEIVWAYTGPSNTKRWFPRKHDTILFYVKSDSAAFNRDNVRVPYKAESFTMGGSGSLVKKVKGKVDYKTGAEEYLQRGKIIEDWWTDIPSLSVADERLGYPTQKPLALYERIIKAASNVGDLVLDPFCGCATTPIAAERLGRQWVGMDIWDGAYNIVLERLEQENLAVSTDGRKEGEGETSQEESPSLTFGDVYYKTEPPIRTDAQEVAAPILRLKLQRPVEPWQRLSHKEIRTHLSRAQLYEDRIICAGCGRQLEVEFMELDHVLPRSDGGANDISNRILLCGPCNRRKSNALTLSGLVRENKKEAWMYDEALAKHANIAARHHAERVRDEMSLIV